MSSSSTKPYIFLACTQPGRDTGPAAYCQDESKAIARLLRPLEEEGGAKVIQAREGTRVYVEDVFFQKQTRDQISILYVAGSAEPDGALVFPARSGEVRLQPAAFAEVIGGFRNLNLVVLNGLGTPELVTALLGRGITTVLALDQAHLEQGVAREFFFQLVQGKSLRQALEDVQSENDWSLRFEEVCYDATAHRLGWEEIDAALAPPTGHGGLIILAEARKHLNWRLRNPLLIPISEKDAWKKRKPGAALPTDERPNARLRQVRRSRPEGTREPRPERQRLRTPDERQPVDRERRKPTRRRPIKKPNPTAQVEDPKSWSQRLRRGLYAVLGVVAVLGVTVLLVPQAKSWLLPWLATPAVNEEDCPFSDGDPRYRVLLLPFQNYPACTEVQEAYQDQLGAHLQYLVETESLPLTFKRNNLLRACGKDQALLRDMSGVCHADLIVWGEYYRDTITGREVVDIRYFSTNQSGEQIFLDGSASFRHIPVSEIDEATGGPLVQNIETMIYWALAGRRMQLDDYDAAIDLLGRISGGNQEVETMVSLMLTQCYVRSEQFAQAEGYYNELVAMRPGDARLFLERAELRERMGKYDSALVDYNRTLTLEPDNLLARLGRGALYRETGESFKALNDFSALIREQPDLVPAYAERAQVFQALNRPFDALRDYDKALDLDSTYVGAYYGRAQLHYKRRNLTQAFADIERALAVEPGYTEALLFRGDMLAEEGNWSEAVRAYTRIIEQRPLAEAYLRRAQAQRKLNVLDAAIADLTEALRLRHAYDEAWLLRGQLRVATGAYETALGDFSEVISRQPDHAEAYCLRGQAWSKLGQPDSARLDFETAIDLNTDDPLPYYFRSELALEQGNYAAALADADAALRLDNRSAQAYLIRGRVNLAQDQAGAARQDLSRAINLDPSLADAYAYRGQAYLAANNLSTARRDFEQAIEAGTLLADPYLFLGDIHRQQGDAAAAATAYAAAIQLSPQDTTAYLRRAALLLETNQPEEALADLSQAVELGAQQATTLINRGLAYQKLGQYNQALVDFNRAIRQQPDSARPYCLRGLLYRDMGKINQALEDFTKALDLDPRLPEAYFSQGVLQQGLEAYDQALIAYDQAIDLNPRYADAYNKRGEIFVIQEEFDRAVRDFNEAIRLDARHAPAYNNLGDLFRKAGDYPRAIRNYSLALDYDPRLADAWYYRGFIYFMQKRYREAVADIRRSLEIKPDEGLRYGLLAKIYARQQEDELFFQHIELALQHDYPTLELTKEQAYQPYREDPRFQRLLDTYQK